MRSLPSCVLLFTNHDDNANWTDAYISGYAWRKNFRHVSEFDKVWTSYLLQTIRESAPHRRYTNTSKNHNQTIEIYFIAIKTLHDSLTHPRTDKRGIECKRSLRVKKRKKSGSPVSTENLYGQKNRRTPSVDKIFKTHSISSWLCKGHFWLAKAVWTDAQSIRLIPCVDDISARYHFIRWKRGKLDDDRRLLSSSIQQKTSGCTPQKHYSINKISS